MKLFQTWRSDAQASLVVFLVALPLCLGIALASNAPLASGLFAGIIGGVVVGFFSGSNISVSGPAAGLTVIVVNAITELGTFEAFTLAVFLSGLIQLLFGLFKGGIIGNFFPNSVIKGMLAAIGLILILKQLPHALGYNGDFSSFHFGAIVISSVSLTLMISWEMFAKKGLKFFRLFPGALAAVILGMILNEVFKASHSSLILASSHLVALPFEGGWNEIISNVRLPDWGELTNPLAYKVAFTIALVGSMESLLSIDAADKLDQSGKVTSKNRELYAQGIGNTLSGLLGGLPITAVIVRTSANATAGARSKLSAILHGVWLLLCVMLIPGLLNKIPLSALAAVLILVGYKLTKPALIKSVYEKGMNQFIPFAVTIFAILLTDLLVGIGIGMVVGLIFTFKANMQKAIVIVKDDNSYLVRFHKDTTFLHKAHLIKTFDKIPNNTQVILDGGKVFLDEDIIELVEDFIRSSARRNIHVTLERTSLAVNRLFKESYYGNN